MGLRKPIIPVNPLDMGAQAVAEDDVPPAANPISMSSPDDLPFDRSPASVKKAKAKAVMPMVVGPDGKEMKDMEIPDSGGATQSADGVITLPPTYAEGSPAVPRTDLTDILKTGQASGTKPVNMVEDKNVAKTEDEDQAKTVDENDVTDKADHTTKSGTGAENKLYDPEGLAERLKSASSNPAIQRMMTGLDTQEKMINDELTHPGSRGTDLRGFAAFVDNNYGTDYGKYLDKPVSDLERQKVLMSALDKVQDNRRDLAKSLLDTAKAQEYGKTSTNQSLIDLVGKLATNKMTNSDTQTTKNTNVQTDLNPDMLALKAKAAAPKATNGYDKQWDVFRSDQKPLVQMASTIPEINALLTNKAGMSDEATKRIIIKAFGGERPNETAAASFGGNQTWLNKAQRLFDKSADTGASFTDQDRAEAKTMMASLSGYTQHRVHDLIEQQATAVPLAHPEIDPDNFRQFMYSKIGMTPAQMANMAANNPPAAAAAYSGGSAPKKASGSGGSQHPPVQRKGADGKTYTYTYNPTTRKYE